MKLKYLAIGLMMLFCLNVFGQQQKTVPMTVQPQKAEVQALEETISQLQTENHDMQKQLKNLEKEVGICREDVRAKEAAINDNQGHWLTLLSIVIGAIVMILGVAVPIIVNNKHENYVFKLLEDAKYEAREAAVQAKQATRAVADIEELKRHVTTIEETISKNAIAAEQSAIEAKASQLFFQAFSEKDPFKAIELYTEAIELKPNMTEAYINRGKLRHDVGDFEEAMKDYDDAIKLDPNDATAFFNRGNLKDAKEDKIGALKDFDRTLTLDSKYVGAYINRGSVKRDLGDLIGALKDFEKAIELNSADATAYNNRATVLMELGELNKALDTVNDALAIDGSVFVIWKTKGEICMKMGNYEGAEFAFTRAILLNPKDKESIMNRAACYRKMAELENDEMKKTDYLSKALDDELRLKQ